MKKFIVEKNYSNAKHAINYFQIHQPSKPMKEFILRVNYLNAKGALHLVGAIMILIPWDYENWV